MKDKACLNESQALDKLGRIYKNLDKLDAQCKPAITRFKSTQKLRPKDDKSENSNLFYTFFNQPKPTQHKKQSLNSAQILK